MAIHALAERKFDLLVLDIGLPGKDGYKLLTHLRGTLRLEVPVILLTARGSLEDKKTGFTVGADDYLTKPFALEELVYRIKALLRRADSTPGFLIELSHGALRMSVRNQQRSEEHTSELQSLMRISYAVFCLKKKNNTYRYKHKEFCVLD